MKTAFKVGQSLSLGFIIMSIIMITFIGMFNDNMRHPLTDDTLLEVIFAQAILLAMYLVCKIGVYSCNTYSFEVKKRR
jgi:hypothetical protein